MSARALNWAWQQQPKTAAMKLVLAAMADRADDDGFCFPSIEWIAKKCAPMSTPNVRRRLYDLVEAGLVEKVERRRREDGTLSTWLYRLPVDQWANTPSGEGEPVGNLRRAEPSIKNTGTDVPVQAPDSLEKDPLDLIDRLWDACEEYVQKAPAAKSPRSAYAKLVREMFAAGWTPEMVRVRAKAYRRHHTLGKTMLTLAALAKWGEEVDRRSNGLARTPVAASEWGEVEVLPAEENARRMRELAALVAGDAIGVPSPASSALPHAPEAGGPPPMPSPGPPAPHHAS